MVAPRMNVAPRRKFALIGAVALLAVALIAVGLGRDTLVATATGFDPTNPAITLSDIERTVSRRYPATEVTAAELAKHLGDPDTIVFDVREPDEHATSRIPGATLIPPGLSAAEFMSRHGAATAGKRVVFYCAVGVRSGIMATRAERALAAAGARAVQNLRGGLFRWHAEGRTLVTEAGPATTVHPYDAAWGQLLARTLDAAGRPAPGTSPKPERYPQSRPPT